ncbi:MAG: hypothetical protein ABI430_01600 [Candidatus Taylorbacteria bacterium]
MLPEEKELLEKTYKLSEENNEILKGMRRSQRRSNIMRASYWILIIFLSIGGVYFAQMYISSLLGAFGDESPSAKSSNIIDQYKELLNQ